MKVLPVIGITCGIAGLVAVTILSNNSNKRKTYTSPPPKPDTREVVLERAAIRENQKKTLQKNNTPSKIRTYNLNESQVPKPSPIPESRGQLPRNQFSIPKTTNTNEISYKGKTFKVISQDNIKLKTHNYHLEKEMNRFNEFITGYTLVIFGTPYNLIYSSINGTAPSKDEKEIIDNHFKLINPKLETLAERIPDANILLIEQLPFPPVIKKIESVFKDNDLLTYRILKKGDVINTTILTIPLPSPTSAFRSERTRPMRHRHSRGFHSSRYNPLSIDIR